MVCHILASVRGEGTTSSQRKVEDRRDILESSSCSGREMLWHTENCLYFVFLFFFFCGSQGGDRYTGI